MKSIVFRFIFVVYHTLLCQFILNAMLSLFTLVLEARIFVILVLQKQQKLGLLLYRKIITELSLGSSYQQFLPLVFRP